MLRATAIIIFIALFLNVDSVMGQCFSKDGRTQLMPFGIHLMGLQQRQDSLQLAILSTKYMCLDQGDKSNIEFTDGSFIYLSNLLELNCDGKAYFNLTEDDRLQLSSKEISKVVFGSQFAGNTVTAIPEGNQATAFRELMDCAVNHHIIDAVQQTQANPIDDNPEVQKSDAAPTLTIPPPQPLSQIEETSNAAPKKYQSLPFAPCNLSLPLALRQLPN